jgi:hypothetical protein
MENKHEVTFSLNTSILGGVYVFQLKCFANTAQG